jgi:heparin/heparan-sulfate lyase
MQACRCALGLAALVLGTVGSSAWGADADAEWLSRLRPDHPRLFVNAAQWPQVQARALGEAKPYYERLKKRVDGYPAEPAGSSGGAVVQKEQRIGGQVVAMPEAAAAKEWGPQALETAFVYRLTGERQYLDKARRMLEVSIAVYRQCYAERRAVNWYSTTRVCALTAYDWLYNDLTPEQRQAIAVPLLQHVDDVQPGRGKPAIHRSNSGASATDGFYGVANLVWFAGLAAHGDGIADELALRFLKTGYEYNRKLFAYRAQCAGDDGGLASATVGYALGAYPWSQFNFLYTWRSATGENLAPQWEHLAYYPIWILWNWIPGAEGQALEFGSGDTQHYGNELPTWLLYEHMSQLIALYGASHPDCMALAERIRQQLPEKGRTFANTWPLYPFLAETPKTAPTSLDLSQYTLKARHFEALGQVIMRSGWGADDTHCLFTCGSTVDSHKQYDENSFIIYKKGFLALDSGTRGNEKDYNLRHYYAQTVAHNAMLIRLPEEPFATYWGQRYDGPEGKYNDGGMNRTTGATVKAFETDADITYVAGDATACYSDRKCALALRQFVFVMPDIFVICDRVTSTQADYRKAWLLHTQNEPQIDGATCRSDEGGGRLFCRTLLPAAATLEKIGGPGKEFWSNGRNWDVNDTVLAQQERQRASTGKGMLWGNWRIEVGPTEARTEDVFLHVLQTGDPSTQAMVATETIREAGQVGARLSHGGRGIEVRFGTTGGPTGRLRIAQAGKVLVERELTQSVQPQSGLGLP